jgi:hypothetical protein
MTMGAILATIAGVRLAIADINREAVRNKLISWLIYYLELNPSMAASAKPSAEASVGGVCSSMKTMPLERQTTPSCWGFLCAVCFASQKSSNREFFVFTRRDLGVELIRSALAIKLFQFRVKHLNKWFLIF